MHFCSTCCSPVFHLLLADLKYPSSGLHSLHVDNFPRTFQRYHSCNRPALKCSKEGRLHSHIRWTLISKTGVWVCVIDQLCGSELTARSVTGLIFLNGSESLALNDYKITTESLNNFDEEYISTGALFFSLSTMN